MSAARVWERRIDGWRRSFMRNPWLKNYAVLAGLTIFAYVLWSTGVVGRTSAFVSQKTTQVMVSAGFSVQRITFSGHMETSPRQVMDAMGVDIGAPIFAVNLNETRARIESLDWVGHATVVRALPGTIHVSIDEREPYAIWQNDGELHVISEDGTVIPSADVDAYSQLPHVVGAGADREAHHLFQAMETVPQLAPRVRFAVRVSDRRWDLHFDSGVVVQLPESHVDHALASLAQYESEYRLLARAIDEVDLRLDDRIVIRPRGDGEDGPAFALPTAERET
jgi:cell division protein FtsQ